MQIYGYCRISTPQQNIERQVRNILSMYPTAHIIREVYTGTTYQGRRELDKLLHTVQAGDTIVFDSVLALHGIHITSISGNCERQCPYKGNSP